MSILKFIDKSYIEITKTPGGEKLFVTIAAKSSDNTNKLIANCIEITEKDLFELIKSAK